VDGIRTYYFRDLSMYLAGNMNLPVPHKLPYVAWREIREFDVVHIHEHRTFLAAVVATLASRAGVP
ncbi:MAG: LPS biosynthesis protein, partial [Methanothermobacter thermautotrophicus]